MKKHYFFFVSKQRFRKITWNNFIKIKKIKNYKIIDLTGPIKYFIFSRLLIFITNRFHTRLNNFTLISCDGHPYLKNNSVNMWFGGSAIKIPSKFSTNKNNLVIVKNNFSTSKNFLTLYPHNIKKISFNNNFKIIYVGSIKTNYFKKSEKIWNNYKKEIIKNFSLIDSKKFWEKFKTKNINEKNNIYRDLKGFLRIYILKKVKKNFNENLILIGDDMRKYFKDAHKTTNNFKYIRDLYQGNLCLDFGSRWGDITFYPRSIEILESGGYLLQSKQSDSFKAFGHLNIDNTFNNAEELLKKIHLYKKNFNLLNVNSKKIYNYYNKVNHNYNALTEIKKISNR